MERAPAYLRSIVLFLARHHNQRGLVLRLRDQWARDRCRGRWLPINSFDRRRSASDRRSPAMPVRHDCMRCVLEELSIDQIATTSGSANSVKTHLRRDGRADRSLGEA